MPEPQAFVAKDVMTGPKRKYEYREVEVAGLEGWALNTIYGRQAPILDVSWRDGRLLVRLRRSKLVNQT